MQIFLRRSSDYFATQIISRTMAGTDQESTPRPHLATQMATRHPQRHEPVATILGTHEDNIFCPSRRTNPDGLPILQRFFDLHPIQHDFFAFEDGHIGRHTRAAI